MIAMKKIRILLSMAATLPVLAFAPVALAATNSATNGTSSPDASTSSTPASTPASDGTKQSTKTLAERVAEYKTKLATQPTAAQQTNLKAKCKAAQVIGKTLATKVTTSDTTRAKAYADIDATLATIVSRLGDADADVKALTEQQTKVTELVQTYTTDAAAYKTVLADMNTVDCVTDPIAFKATLEVARTNRAALNKDAAAIRTYITDTVKPSLKTAQGSLAKDTPAAATTDKTDAANATKKENQ